MSVTLKVNGKTQTCDGSISIRNLLAELNIPAATVVVERNRKILRKEQFPAVIIEDGDEVEIIRFVGGG
ncbi:MAG: sulfur carrier protein ThiS [Desulfomonilaceae bacterium]|nr:sulfur carrier protein ThiS [Desulfomonilaceae bacterium]